MQYHEHKNDTSNPVVKIYHVKAEDNKKVARKLISA